MVPRRPAGVRPGAVLHVDHEELIVTRADGSDPVSVAGDMDISQPAWSPDGSRIAFVEGALRIALRGRADRVPRPASTRLFLADVACAPPVGPSSDLAAPDGCPILSEPQWSPDGSQIALASRGVYLVDVASGRLTELLSPTDAVAAAWSPDGRRLAVTAAPTDGEPSGRVLVVDADGQGLTEIAPRDRLDWQPGLVTTGRPHRLHRRTGTSADCLSSAPTAAACGPWRSERAAGSPGRPTVAAWRWASRTLLTHQRQASSNIYTVDVDDGATTRLTDVDASE